MRIKKGFTMLEVVMVLVVIVILSGIAVPNYIKAKEGIAKKEAFSQLRLLQAAERSFYMDTKSYYPSSGGNQPNMDTINNDLKLNLPVSGSRNWDYVVYDTGCVQATRTADSTLKYRMYKDDADPSLGGCS